MTSIIGIPTTRTSTSLIHQQLARQLQYAQQALYRVEEQLATGRRIALPSEDPSAAVRILDGQRLLEQNQQAQDNLEIGLSYLAATDTALSQVAGLLAEVRATAVGAIGVTATDEMREAAAVEVEATLTQLVSAGNQKFRGRYLFGGTAVATQPLELVGESMVTYSGGETRLSSYSDIDTLFDINVAGSEVFGAISESVRGTVDLDPVVSFETRLADLRGGLGISPGSVAVSANDTASIVDLSQAETLGDVALLLRNNAPEGTSLNLEITHTGLKIELDAAPGTLLKIEEVGGGTIATELGILTETGVSGPVESQDLNPILRATARLDDVLGSRAYAVVRFDGADNDLIFEADEVGDALNGIQIVFVDDGSVIHPGADEQATYDPATQTLTVTVAESATSAADAVRAVNTAFAAGTVPINARLDPLDETLGGAGRVEVTPPGDYHGLTAGGGGAPLDLAAGIRVQNGGETYTIDFSGAETVEDLLGTINGAGAGLRAEINETATGIDVRSCISGCDFTIGENGGTTAAQLGLRSFTRDTRLEDLNYGRGVHTADGTDFTITLADTTVAPIEIDASGVEAIGELLDLINTQSPGKLEARLATEGNGIELVDLTVGTGVLTVRQPNTEGAATDLGLIPQGETEQIAGALPPGQPDVLRGSDVNPLETEGIFTALTRLLEGLQANDNAKVERALEMLDDRALSLSFSRAELGMRQQNLELMQSRLEDHQINLQEAVSLDFDVDLVQAVSDYEARSIALEAALTATSQLLQLSLLNYL